MRHWRILLLFTLFCFFGRAFAAAPWYGRIHGEVFPQATVPAPEAEDWASATLAKMSLEEKIAQLVVIQVYSNTTAKQQAAVLDMVKRYQPGGICFFDGGPLRQISLTNRLQRVSKVPLLISIDGEWGPAMRLDSCLQFPRQMQLGALPPSDAPLVAAVGRAIARQCRLLGVNLNFAPCIDINNNPQNPVINSRAFGDTRESVASCALAMMQGMRDGGTSVCAKHFPGHGDTHIDSHHNLPIITKSYQQLDDLELYPFKKMIENEVDMVMVGHLNVPALDSGKNAVASVSKPIITDLLKERLGYQGIVITDAMGMNGLRKTFPHDGEAEVLALLAGVDILLMPSDFNIVISKVKSAIKSGRLSEELIDERCLRVLCYKQKLGLERFEPIPTDNVYAQLNSEADKALIDSVEAESITLLRNEEMMLPVLPESASSTLLLCVGGLSDSLYYKELAERYGIGYMQVPRSIKVAEYGGLMARMAPYTNVIVTMLSTNQTVKYNYGIYDESVAFLDAALAGKNAVLALMGNPYALQRFGRLDDYKAVIVGYVPTKNAVDAMLRCVFGKRQFMGQLPVSVLGFVSGTGYKTFIAKKIQANVFPMSISVLPDKTNYRIDSLVMGCIERKVLPGCQVMAMRGGKVIYYKNFGHLTYDKAEPVTSTTMYDIASMTKSLATTLAVMKLYDEGKLHLTDKVGDFLDYTKGSAYAKIPVAELLTHTAGLAPFIGFYRDITPNNRWDTAFIRSEWSQEFSVKAAEGVYLRSDFPDIARKKMVSRKLGEKKYDYSDLSFILLKDIVEAVSGQPLDEYLTENFYLPMGLRRTGFNPREFVEDSNIAPTEDDRYFRMQVLQGYVHDQSAAVFGGVSGNAGLFSTAQEVSAILTMLMNGGEYKGRSYLSAETVRLFETTYPLHGCKRRALGFDTPSFAGKSTILPAMADRTTFGHQGFTGTVFWCDPKNDLMYIFLSNRVHPTTEPNNLSKSRLRLTVHEEIYKGLGINE